MKFVAVLIALLAAPAVAFTPVTKARAAQIKEVAAAAAAAAVLTTAAPAFAGDVDAGALVFSANCAACHAGGTSVCQACRRVTGSCSRPSDRPTDRPRRAFAAASLLATPHHATPGA